MDRNEFGGRTPRYLDDYDECDDCGRISLLALTTEGRFCGGCIPDDKLAELLEDLHNRGV